MAERRAPPDLSNEIELKRASFKDSRQMLKKGRTEVEDQNLLKKHLFVFLFTAANFWNSTVVIPLIFYFFCYVRSVVMFSLRSILFLREIERVGWIVFIY